MSKDYKYYGNDNAICPHCDYEDQDSWEWAQEGGSEKDVECGNCGKEFHLTIDHTTTYTTSKVES